MVVVEVVVEVGAMPETLGERAGLVGLEWLQHLLRLTVFR